MTATPKNSPFPSAYEEGDLETENPLDRLYYVYWHQHPKTREVLYIGHGSYERAWTIGRPGLPLRSDEHNDCLVGMMSEGYLPCDWVFIYSRLQTKTDACQVERGLIKKYKPRFNKIQGAKLLKVTPEILEEAFQMRENGYSYSQIADALNLATMTIHRAMNGKSPALEEVIARTN